ncbi:MAG: DUF370 domain-containing protein [Oscillospiraceae bacterium]
MFLHLGGDVVVKDSEIIGIFDIETASVSKITKEYFAASEARERVINVSYELPKTFIICNKNGKIFLYISQISSATLKKRANI